MSKNQRNARIDQGHRDSGGIGAVPVAFLGAIALVASGLAVFQWMELLHAQQGGTPLCAISETLDCRTVWSSAFAKFVHRSTRLPIAGWGLLWGIVALGTVLFAWMQREDSRVKASIAAVRLTALVGIAASIALFGVSVSMGVYCVTCVGTYALVLAFAVVAHKLPGRLALVGTDGLGALKRAAVLFVLGYAALLYPASKTSVEASPRIGAEKKPVAGQPSGRDVPLGSNSSGDPLLDLFASLPPGTRQGISDSIQIFRGSLPRDTSRWPPRKLHGPVAAPLRIVEFSDIRCVHCRAFSEVIREIETTVPEGAFSLELRQFPLDATCNSSVPREVRDDSGVRCTAAKALICIEPFDRSREAQEEMFREQDRLTVPRILEIASNAGMGRADLERCIQSAETALKLSADVEYAKSFDIDGTPLVIVNDRKATSFGPFLLGLVLSGGDLGARAWKELPPPRAP